MNIGNWKLTNYVFKKNNKMVTNILIYSIDDI